jgi:WD40 repeat protein
MARVFRVAFLVFALTVTLLVATLAQAQQFSEWSPPTNLNAILLSDGTVCPPVVNAASNDMQPTISKDGRSLIFTSDRPGGSGAQDLWVTERASVDDCWKKPMNLGSIVNSPYNDAGPNLTTDGHWLYFHSRRLGGCSGGSGPSFSAELWVTHRRNARDDSGWEKPINLGCTINMQGFHQNAPLHFEDETTGTQFLYFTRLPVGKPLNFYAIYVSICIADLATCNTHGLWSSGIPVDAFNPPPGGGETTRTAIRRRDGLEMIFSSGRAGGLGGIDLWRSARPAITLDQKNWSPPVPLTVLNSPATDGGPALSWDGTELYFHSNRAGVPGVAGGSDLYISKRTKLMGGVGD